jgi:hypothetical protein
MMSYGLQSVTASELVEIDEDDIAAYNLTGRELKFFQREWDDYCSRFPHMRLPEREEYERRDFVHELLAEKELARQAAAKQAIEAKKALPPARPRKTAPTYVTLKSYERDMEAIGKVMKEVIDPMLSRLEALEAKSSMEFRGVWRDGNQYQAGNVVSHGGSGWVCKAANQSQRPGEAPRHWQLFVKRGRDAK